MVADRWIGLERARMFTKAQASEILVAARKGVSSVAGSFGRSFGKADMADLVAETAIRTLERFDASKGTVGGLAYTVARSVATDFLRGRQSAGGSKESALPTDGETGEILDIPDECESALDALVGREKSLGQSADLKLMLEALTPAQRKVLEDETDGPESGGDRVARCRALKTLRDMVPVSPVIRRRPKG